MANMSPPSVTAPPVPVVKDDHFRLLLKTCEGKTFSDYRDAAILSLLFDTGARLSEITNLRLSDVDNGEMPQIRVIGEDLGAALGRLTTASETRKALRNYEKARSLHPLANLDWLWLGSHGEQLTQSGIAQMLRRRTHTGWHPRTSPAHVQTQLCSFVARQAVATKRAT